MLALGSGSAPSAACDVVDVDEVESPSMLSLADEYNRERLFGTTMTTMTTTTTTTRAGQSLSSTDAATLTLAAAAQSSDDRDKLARGSSGDCVVLPLAGANWPATRSSDDATDAANVVAVPTTAMRANEGAQDDRDHDDHGDDHDDDDDDDGEDESELFQAQLPVSRFQFAFLCTQKKYNIFLLPIKSQATPLRRRPRRRPRVRTPPPIAAAARRGSRRLPTVRCM